MDRIPVEVLELIFQTVEPACLAPLRLVSRAFSEVSRPLFFRSLKILATRTTPSICRTLRFLLEDDCRCGKHVRDIVISRGSRNIHAGRKEGPLHDPLLPLNLLNQLLPNLISLHSLRYVHMAAMARPIPISALSF